MKQNERDDRREKYNKNITHAHEVVLRDLEDIVELLWEGEKLISYYTEHGVAHSYRIINNINKIIEGKEAVSDLKENDYIIC